VRRELGGGGGGDDRPEAGRPRVTLIVGHDGDLDALAQYFDLRQWAAPPYEGPFPTPPGSGLLFERAEDGRVSSTFLYPVFTNADGSRNISGRLRRAPAKATLPWAEWDAVATRTLEQVPLGAACYANVSRHYGDQ
jgi:hypothetical protein